MMLCLHLFGDDTFSHHQWQHFTLLRWRHICNPSVIKHLNLLVKICLHLFIHDIFTRLRQDTFATLQARLICTPSDTKCSHLFGHDMFAPLWPRHVLHLLADDPLAPLEWRSIDTFSVMTYSQSLCDDPSAPFWWKLVCTSSVTIHLHPFGDDLFTPFWWRSIHSSELFLFDYSYEVFFILMWFVFMCLEGHISNFAQSNKPSFFSCSNDFWPTIHINFLFVYG